MKIYRCALRIIFFLSSFSFLSSQSIADTVYFLPTEGEIKNNWNLNYQIDTLASNSECENNYQYQCHAYHSNIGIDKGGYHWASSDLGGEPSWWARVAVDQYNPAPPPPPQTPTGFTIQNVLIRWWGIRAYYTIYPSPSNTLSYYTPFKDVASQIMFWVKGPIAEDCKWDGKLTITCPSTSPAPPSHPQEEPAKKRP